MNGSNFFKKNPSFLKLWSGQILSQSCGRMAQMAWIWWLINKEKENPGIWTGSFMVMTALPGLLLVKKIGDLIQNNPSKKVLVISDSLACALIFLSAVFIYFGHFDPWLLLFFGLGASTLQSFIDPTLNKSVSEVVNQEHLGRATSLLSSTQSIANFSGAILGAMLINQLQVYGVCYLASLGYFISAVLSSQVDFKHKIILTQNSEESFSWKSTPHFLKKVLIGFSFINFFATPTLVVLPLFTKLVLQGDASLLARNEAILWLGILSGTFLSGQLSFFKKATTIAGVCLSLFGIMLVLAGSFPSPLLYQVALAICGFSLGVNNVKFMTLFQTMIANHHKAKFFALMQAMLSTTFPIAYFIFGLLVDWINPALTCVFQGVGVISIALCFFFMKEVTYAPLERDGVSAS